MKTKDEKSSGGFTLIELLVVIGIMATMVTVGVVSLGASRGSTRTFAAVRDVMSMVRRARSLALVTQKPVVIVYSNGKDGDEACAKVEIQAEKLFSSDKAPTRVWNLAGKVITESEPATGDAKNGETLEDVLSPAAIPSDVVKGLKLKVLDESEELALPENETRRSKISIFSTADNISRTFIASVDESTEKGSEAATEETVRVAFAANGTVDPPHRIWIYREESTPEKGLCIHVDRFGEPHCEDLDE